MFPPPMKVGRHDDPFSFWLSILPIAALAIFFAGCGLATLLGFDAR
jgi:hypothetical protein